MELLCRMLIRVLFLDFACPRLRRKDLYSGMEHSCLMQCPTYVKSSQSIALEYFIYLSSEICQHDFGMRHMLF
jgi:hypothetical protein